MALTVKQGDLFRSEAQTLVNTVNCVGVMGKGIALEFKKRYPEMFEDYARRCEAGRVRLGQPYLYKRPAAPWILNFPTKGNWREYSRLDRIISGLEYLEAHYREWGIESLAVPPLGAGSGGLEWGLVGRTLHRYLSRLDIPVELYAPHEVPARQLEMAFLASPPEPAPTSVGLLSVASILGKLQQLRHSPPVGRTKFQKLAYFATVVGIPTGLTYERASYGPFAAGLKRVTSTMINNGLVHESASEHRRLIAIRTGPAFEDARTQHEAELSEWEAAEARVVDLMSRISTGDQAELAATIMFSARALADENDEPPTDGQVLDYVQDWKKRRNGWFADGEVAEAIAALHSLGWVEVQPTERVRSMELMEMSP